MKLRALIVLAMLPAIAAAEPLPAMLCRGDNPLWTLDLSGETALFNFQRSREMSIPHQTSAEGQDWPRALTLINRNDTAIVIIDRQSCNTGDHSAHVLTQRGDTPILLTGCCAAIP